VVAQTASDGGGESARGLSTLDAALLRRVAELAAKEEGNEDLRTLAKATIGVIQMQAEMAELFSQFMQHVSNEQRRAEG
jgi:hypothetical protein